MVYNNFYLDFLLFESQMFRSYKMLTRFTSSKDGCCMFLLWGSHSSFLCCTLVDI